MRGDFLKSYVSSSYWLVSGKYAQSIMEALNSDVLSVEAKATEYKGGIRPAQSYEKIITILGLRRLVGIQRNSTGLGDSSPCLRLGGCFSRRLLFGRTMRV